MTINTIETIGDIQDALFRGAKYVEVHTITLFKICKMTQKECERIEGSAGLSDKEFFDLVDKRLRQDGLYIAGAGSPIPGTSVRNDRAIRISRVK